MRICSKCGYELNEGVKFCTQCGAKLTVTKKAALRKAVVPLVLGIASLSDFLCK